MQGGLDGLAAPLSAVVSTCMQGGLDGLAAPRSWDRGLALMGDEGRGCEGSEAAKEDMLVSTVAKRKVRFYVVLPFDVNARLWTGLNRAQITAFLL